MAKAKKEAQQQLSSLHAKFLHNCSGFFNPPLFSTASFWIAVNHGKPLENKKARSKNWTELNIIVIETDMLCQEKKGLNIGLEIGIKFVSKTRQRCADTIVFHSIYSQITLSLSSYVVNSSHLANKKSCQMPNFMQ